MQIEDIFIEGVKIIKINPFSDKRGTFSNIFPIKERKFSELWSTRNIGQINISSNNKVGCIRGMHYQTKPYEEAKLIRCLKGKIWDVVVDTRPESRTFRKWFGIELSDLNFYSIFVPEGIAHGFQVLEKDSQVLYVHSGFWEKDSEKGVHCKDPKVSIRWPLEISDISEKDEIIPFL